jgi:hypothetical protein
VVCASDTHSRERKAVVGGARGEAVCDALSEHGTETTRSRGGCRDAGARSRQRL